jgi:arylsulfatase A-like enzyme
MQNEKPHVLVITCHDLGRHLRCYGVETVRSANLDRLAARGVLFEQAFCTAPQCSPSRATLATGRYPHSNGVMGLTHGGFGWDLNPDEKHAAAALAEHGYATHLFGLQHVTREVERLGFQQLHAAASGPEGSTGSSAAPEVAAAFEAFLRYPRGNRPLYMEINFFEPHRPYQYGGVQPDTAKGVFVPAYLPQTAPAREEMAALQGAVGELDRAVGRVLDALDQAGLSKSTFVLFSSDHGLAMPRAKCTLYDPGIGIALIARPGGEAPAGRRVSQLVSNVDVLPTILEASGVPLPARLQGVSLLPLLGGEPVQPRDAVFAEKTFHSYYDPMRCIRTPRFKYIRNFETAFAVEVPGDVQQGAIFRSDPGRYSTDRDRMAELYDLLADPQEKENLAGSPAVADVEDDLDRRLWRWMEETQDPLLQGPIPSPRFQEALGARRAEAR